MPDQLRNAWWRTTAPASTTSSGRRRPPALLGGLWAEIYTVELADPPAASGGRLVARIMPDPDTAAFETAVERHVHHSGLPVPAIRAASGPIRELDRAWTLMDLAGGNRCSTDSLLPDRRVPAR